MMLFVMDSSLYRPGPWVGRSPEDLMERGQGCPRLGAGPSSLLPGGSHFCTPPYTEIFLSKFRQCTLIQLLITQLKSFITPNAI